MTVVRIGAHNEVIIPKERLDELGVKPGDYVEVSVHPVGAYPETDEALGPETRAGIARGLQEIDEARNGGVLQTKEALEAYFARFLGGRVA